MKLEYRYRELISLEENILSAHCSSYKEFLGYSKPLMWVDCVCLPPVRFALKISSQFQTGLIVHMQSTLTKVPNSFCTKAIPTHIQEPQSREGGEPFTQVRHHCAFDTTFPQIQVSQGMAPSEGSGCTWGGRKYNVTVISCNVLSWCTCISLQT